MQRIIFEADTTSELFAMVQQWSLQQREVLDGMNDIRKRLNRLRSLAMASNQQISDVKNILDGINDLTNVLSSNVNKVVASEATQLALIQQLQAQVASGTTVDPADLETLKASAESRRASLQAISDTLQAIAKDPVNPVPDPPVVGEV